MSQVTTAGSPGACSGNNASTSPSTQEQLSFATGQCPVMRHNRQLMMAILHDRVQIAKAVNATVIGLDEAPRGYAESDQGAAKKFVIDPHGATQKAS